MKMRADLNGPISRIGDFQFDFPASLICDHRAFRQLVFTWNHRAPSTSTLCKKRVNESFRPKRAIPLSLALHRREIPRFARNGKPRMFFATCQTLAKRPSESDGALLPISCRREKFLQLALLPPFPARLPSRLRASKLSRHIP